MSIFSTSSSNSSVAEKKEKFRAAVRRRWNHFLHHISKETTSSEHESPTKEKDTKPHRKSPRPKPRRHNHYDDDAQRGPSSSSSSSKHHKTPISLPPHELSIAAPDRPRGRPRPAFTSAGEILNTGTGGGALWDAQGWHQRRSRTLSGHRREADDRLFTVQEEMGEPEAEVEEHIQRLEELRAVGRRWRGVGRTEV